MFRGWKNGQEYGIVILELFHLEKGADTARQPRILYKSLRSSREGGDCSDGGYFKGAGGIFL